MQNGNIRRIVCIAIAIVGIALVGAPAVSAICVGPGDPPPSDACVQLTLPPFVPVDETKVCVTNDPVNNCI